MTTASASASAVRPELAALRVAGAAERWSALGFRVDDDARLRFGAVALELGGDGGSITGWTLRHVTAETDDIDGLATAVTTDPPSPAAPTQHPNGATGLDHVVVTTPDFDRTAGALDRAGLGLRRVRDAGASRQGFRRLGPVILELVELPDAVPGPARFWGLVVIVDDLAQLRRRLGDQLGEIRAAVQPGRQIATLDERAGLGLKLAFMDPG